LRRRHVTAPLAFGAAVLVLGVACGSGSGARPGAGGGNSGSLGTAGGPAGSGGDDLGTAGGAAGGGAGMLGGAGGDGSTAGAGGLGASSGGAAAGTGGAAGGGGTAVAGTGGAAGSGGDGGTAYPRPAYQRLSETGLFADIATQTLAPGVQPYEPAYQLWSDDAAKRRWIRLPPGQQIDTSDMDHWKLPVGTRVWKEFSLGGTLLETRLIERYGPGAEDYVMAPFVWAQDRSDATIVLAGANDVNGTAHDVPMSERCGDCHRGEAGRYLGVSAIQLSHSKPGVNLSSLRSANLLSQPPAGDFPVPGDVTTAAALGVLHANCGHCHNPAGVSWHDTKIVLRLKVSERVPSESELWKTLVGMPLQHWSSPAISTEVVPGDAAHSAVIARMMARGNLDQMPPLATEIPDTDGISAISAWINGLPQP
jgi:hypothetical protein